MIPVIICATVLVVTFVLRDVAVRAIAARTLTRAAVERIDALETRIIRAESIAGSAIAKRLRA